MKTLLLSLLYVFVCSQHTEGVTDQQVTLGQNVILTCELRLKAVIWFVIKPSVRPVMILRTFGSEKPEYYDKKFHNKYKEGSRSQLMINTVTVDDLGTYYCIKPGRALQISDGMRLDTTDVSQEGGAPIKLFTTVKAPQGPDGPDEPEQKNPPQDKRANQILIVVFTLLMLVLFAAVIGLLIMNRKLSRKSTDSPRYVNSQQISGRITSIQTNGTVVPQNPPTDHEYLEVLPYSESVCEIPT